MIVESSNQSYARYSLWSSVPLIMMLVSCLPIVEDTFEVDVGDAAARSAVLILCSSTRRLERRGRVFIGSQPIDCEGSGSIRVELEQGSVECVVGYITPGLEPVHWKFEIRGRSCEDVTYRRR